jgi:hypothetical protein
MRRAIAVTVAALTTACGGAQLTAQEARDAMPAKEQAQIATPGGSSALAGAQAGAALTAAPGGSELAVGGAPFAIDTIVLAAAVNGGVAWTLDIVKFIVGLPPTKCQGDTCTWGPGSGALDLNEFQLAVTKVDDHYAWALSGRAKSNAAAEFTTFVSGNAWPSGVPNVGHGDLTLDLGATAALAHLGTDPDPQGKIVVSNYDNRSGGHLEVQFLGMADSTQAAASKLVNAAYQFDATADGGRLQVATKNIATGEILELSSRWNATGAGRGDAAYSGVAVYTESQCWSSAASSFSLVYDETSTGVVTGDASLCVYQDTVLPSITPPAP